MSNAKVYSNIGQAFWPTYPVLKTTAKTLSSVQQLLNGEDHDITGPYKKLFDQDTTPQILTSDNLGLLYNKIGQAIVIREDNQIKTNSNRTVSFAKGLDTVAGEVHSMAVTTNNGNSHSTSVLHIGKQNSGKLVFSLQTHNGNYSAKDLISDTALKPTTSLDGYCDVENRHGKTNTSSGYNVFVPFTQGKPAASYGYQIDWRPTYTGDKSPTAWQGWLEPSLKIFIRDTHLEKDEDRNTLETLFEIAKYKLPKRSKLITYSKGN